jgi:pimeloyl-ACP methyl ester carboxylesterase
MHKHIYLISGMGADERIFKNLRFPEGYTVHHLHWLPTIPGESFENYATRMAKGIEHDHPTLLGVSFGGMICLEIARQQPVEKVILISSIKHSSEKPGYFGLVKKLGLLALLKLPDALIFRRRTLIVKNFMNIETAEDMQLINDYMQKTSYDYLRWAIPAIVHWQNEFIPASLVHIHGNKDVPFPVRNVKPTHIIAGGGHFMVHNRAAQINEILVQVL